MRRYLAVAVVMAGVLGIVCAAASTGQGAPIVPVTLTNGNSWARIDPTQPLGHDIWVVDGWNLLRREWFWYRVDGPDGTPAEQSLETLDPTPTIVPTDTDGDSLAENLYVMYVDRLLGLSVEVNYNLMGGTPGSGMADLAESVRIINFGNLPRTVHFFEYADFILSDAEDTVWVRQPNTAAQWLDGVRMVEEVATPTPTHVEANLSAALLGALTDALPTTLSDVVGPVGPDDVAWAFQWDFTLEPGGGSYLISKDKLITPEPATLALVGLGLAGLAAKRKR